MDDKIPPEGNRSRLWRTAGCLPVYSLDAPLWRDWRTFPMERTVMMVASVWRG